MKVYKNPHLVIEPIEGDFYVVVNTYINNGLKVINKPQFEILKSIDNLKDIKTLAFQHNIDENVLMSLIDNFSQKEIVNYSGIFNSPVFDSEPKSLNLWIHTTNKCNLTCSYCYISTLQSTGGMTKDTIQQLGNKIEETVIKKRLRSVKLRLAGGEPLLQFKNWKEFIIEMKKRLNSINCKFNVAFLTNLTILPDEILNFIIEEKIGLGISLDGFDLYHDLTRQYHNGKGSFEKVDFNLRKLLENGLRPSVSTVITNSNMEGLPALTEYLLELKIHFRFSIVHGEYIDRERLGKILDICYKLMEDEVEKGYNFSQLHRLCDLKRSDLFFQTCASGFSGGAVYVDGGMYFCHTNFGGETGKQGSVFDDEDLITMIGKGKPLVGKRSDDCLKCKYSYVCTSGCPIYRENGKDLSCQLYHEFLPKIYRLEGKQKLIKLKKQLSKQPQN
ncbi:MAG: radical SAM protein [Cytophagia bacterium]|nr:MAG: radical SAM protein [Cytophagia bacterium]